MWSYCYFYVILLFVFLNKNNMLYSGTSSNWITLVIASTEKPAAITWRGLNVTNSKLESYKYSCTVDNMVPRPGETILIIATDSVYFMVRFK